MVAHSLQEGSSLLTRTGTSVCQGRVGGCPEGISGAPLLAACALQVPGPILGQQWHCHTPAATTPAYFAISSRKLVSP